MIIIIFFFLTYLHELIYFYIHTEVRCFNSRLRYLVANCARLCSEPLSGPTPSTMLHGVTYNTLLRVNMVMGILIDHLCVDLGTLVRHERYQQCQHCRNSAQSHDRAP